MLYNSVGSKHKKKKRFQFTVKMYIFDIVIVGIYIAKKIGLSDIRFSMYYVSHQSTEWKFVIVLVYIRKWIVRMVYGKYGSRTC